MASSSRLPFACEVDLSHDTAIVRCHGKVNIETAAGLKQVVKPMISYCRHIVLDLREVEFVDSHGLGMLVGLQASALAADFCRLEFVNFSPRVKELLRITKLSPMFGA